MHYISITYPLIYQFKDAPNYKVTKCLKVINTKTSRVIKKSYKEGSTGYWIVVNRVKTFVKVGDKKLLERIPKQKTPF